MHIRNISSRDTRLFYGPWDEGRIGGLEDWRIGGLEDWTGRSFHLLSQCRLSWISNPTASRSFEFGPYVAANRVSDELFVC